MTSPTSTTSGTTLPHFIENRIIELVWQSYKQSTIDHFSNHTSNTHNAAIIKQKFEFVTVCWRWFLYIQSTLFVTDTVMLGNPFYETLDTYANHIDSPYCLMKSITGLATKVTKGNMFVGENTTFKQDYMNQNGELVDFEEEDDGDNSGQLQENIITNKDGTTFTQYLVPAQQFKAIHVWKKRNVEHLYHNLNYLNITFSEQINVTDIKQSIEFLLPHVLSTEGIKELCVDGQFNGILDMSSYHTGGNVYYKILNSLSVICPKLEKVTLNFLSDLNDILSFLETHKDTIRELSLMCGGMPIEDLNRLLDFLSPELRKLSLKQASRFTPFPFNKMSKLKNLESLYMTAFENKVDMYQFIADTPSLLSVRTPPFYLTPELIRLLGTKSCKLSEWNIQLDQSNYMDLINYAKTIKKEENDQTDNQSIEQDTEIITSIPIQFNYQYVNKLAVVSVNDTADMLTLFFNGVNKSIQDSCSSGNGGSKIEDIWIKGIQDSNVESLTKFITLNSLTLRNSILVFKYQQQLTDAQFQSICMAISECESLEKLQLHYQLTQEQYPYIGQILLKKANNTKFKGVLCEIKKEVFTKLLEGNPLYQPIQTNYAIKSIYGGQAIFSKINK